MKFNMSYNTDATFDFDNKNLKLAYEGKEDEIIKNLEAGNVSMTTGSSLIRGSAALFGIKTKLQFGKLTATALISQQNSQTQTVNRAATESAGLSVLLLFTPILMLSEPVVFSCTPPGPNTDSNGPRPNCISKKLNGWFFFFSMVSVFFWR